MPLPEDELQRLPVFPLPRVVFFPGSLLPLHLFETRYRDLARYCMEQGPRAMAISLLKPGYEANYEGRPGMHAIAGVGRIVEHRERPDGTHDLILQGMGRVQLDEHPPGQHSFRLARATPLEERGEVSAANMRTLLACSTSVAAVVRARHPEFELGIGNDESAGQTIDTLADRFVAAPEERQAILEALDLEKRCELTLATVSEVLAALAANQDPS
ncbi:MAG: LON peptidase substrate-binding domain-containing protein [Myxococcota bacterium]